MFYVSPMETAKKISIGDTQKKKRIESKHITLKENQQTKKKEDSRR